MALASANFVSAQDLNGHSSLITKIAQKFNLNETDVTAVFEEERNQRHAEMKAQMEEKLNQAVKDGKITEAQKTAILGKMDEMRNNHPESGQFKGLSKEQMRGQMEEKRTEMETWASKTGLTLDTLHELMGGIHKKGFGQMGMMIGR